MFLAIGGGGGSFIAQSWESHSGTHGSKRWSQGQGPKVGKLHEPWAKFGPPPQPKPCASYSTCLASALAHIYAQFWQFVSHHPKQATASSVCGVQGAAAPCTSPQIWWTSWCTTESLATHNLRTALCPPHDYRRRHTDTTYGKRARGEMNLFKCGEGKGLSLVDSANRLWPASQRQRRNDSVTERQMSMRPGGATCTAETT
jgi:hypothetical protein